MNEILSSVVRYTEAVIEERSSVPCGGSRILYSGNTSTSKSLEVKDSIQSFLLNYLTQLCISIPY